MWVNYQQCQKINNKKYSLVMKNQKRIIQHLIQQSRVSAVQYNKQQEIKDQQQQNSRPTLQFDTISSATQQYQYHQHEQPHCQNYSQQYQDKTSKNRQQHAQFQPSYRFQVLVDIGDGRNDTIFMTEKSDPYIQAVNFCQKYKLESFIINLLAQSLTEQVKKQVNQLRKLHNNNHLNNKNTKNVITSKNSQFKGLYKYSKNSQQLWKQSQQDLKGHPKINEVSMQIVKKIGKDKIIQNVSRKFQNKARQVIQDQIQENQKQFESYPFHPHINPISRKVDETLNFSRKNSKDNISRHQHLYEQYKCIQSRKQVQRRNSVMQMPFKPEINEVSRTIIAKKRSLGEFHPLSAGKQRPKMYYKNADLQEPVKKSRKRINKSLNASTSNLCYHLYEQARKRQQKIKKQTQKIYNNNESNWKIIQNSNSLVNSLRQNRIREIFIGLSQPPHKLLHYSQIQHRKLSDVQKIFQPVFNQMKQIQTQLTQQQFVQAGMRLIKYLSPNQRAILIRKNSHIIAEQKQNIEKATQINKKSEEIIKKKGYGQRSIYMRGMMYKNEIKNQIQKGKQDKVRKQLKNCTFKPKINALPQNIGY